jgi:hypothetical protein
MEYLSTDDLSRFLKSAFHRVKFIRPLWYINYSKESAKGVSLAEISVALLRRPSP